jgi:hypothetical protein
VGVGRGESAQWTVPSPCALSALLVNTVHGPCRGGGALHPCLPLAVASPSPPRTTRAVHACTEPPPTALLPLHHGWATSQPFRVATSGSTESSAAAAHCLSREPTGFKQEKIRLENSQQAHRDMLVHNRASQHSAAVNGMKHGQSGEAFDKRKHTADLLKHNSHSLGFNIRHLQKPDMRATVPSSRRPVSSWLVVTVHRHSKVQMMLIRPAAFLDTKVQSTVTLQG